MRKLLVGLVVFVFLIVAAAVVIPLVVPVTIYESRLITLVKQATGRDLKIAGPVKFSVFPALELDASDVSFSNAPDARPPDMIKLKQVQIRLQILPLLRGSVVVSRLVLLQPVIALEVDKAGHPNWVFAPAAAPSAAPAGGKAEPAGAGRRPAISGLVLGKVELSDGKISYFDQRTGRVEQLAGIDMTMSLRSLGGPLAGDGSAVWHGERIKFAVSVDQPHALLDGAQSRLGIKLAAAPVALDFSGWVAGLPSPRLGGVIDLKGKSARELAKWAGAPIAWGSRGLGPFALKGTIAMAGTRTSLSDADFSLDAIRARGSVSIDNAAARTAVTGKLDIDKLNLDPYLAPPTAAPAAPAASSGPAPAPSPAAPSGGSDMPGGVSPLRLADVDLDLNLGGIVYRAFQIGPTALGLHVRDGRLTADLARMALYRGSGRGRVTIDGNGAVPSIGVDVALAQVQIEPLAQAAIGSNRLTGTGSLDIAVTGRGTSQSGFIATLNGRGALGLANGQIRGVNLPALAESAVKIERGLIGTLDVAGALNLLAHGQIKGINPLALAEDAARGLVGGGNATNFGTLTATCTVANGLLRNNDLRLSSGLVPATGAGTVDLRTQAIDYRVSLQLPGGVAVPIQVGGTLDNPSYRPDLAAMLAQTPANALTILKSGGSKVGQDLKAIGQGAVGVLKGLFGK
jgi:AsmA protein